jgi:hypothetical protein
MEQALHAELREQNLCFHCGVYNHLRENCYASEKTATLQRKLSAAFGDVACRDTWPETVHVIITLLCMLWTDS